MPTYTVTNKQTNAEVYRYAADAPIEWNGMEFATHDHIEYVEPVVDTPATPLQERKITRLAFRNRFTTAEKVALEIASLDNPAASMQERGAAATLRAYMADVNAATFVDLSQANTRGGVQQLEAFGLLAPGRALEILDADVTAEEAFNG